MSEIAQIAHRTPFLLLTHEFAAEVFSTIAARGASVTPALIDGTLFGLDGPRGCHTRHFRISLRLRLTSSLKVDTIILPINDVSVEGERYSTCRGRNCWRTLPCRRGRAAVSFKGPELELFRRSRDTLRDCVPMSGALRTLRCAAAWGGMDKTRIRFYPLCC